MIASAPLFYMVRKNWAYPPRASGSYHGALAIYRIGVYHVIKVTFLVKVFIPVGITMYVSLSNG